MKVFADTFYWIALTDPRDSAHSRAAEIRDEIVTTDEVLTEYLNFFCAAPEFLRSQVALAVADILDDSMVKVIPQGRDTFLDGFQLYSKRADKNYSLTDCISMQAMRREGLSVVLTNDRHFEQEGFQAVFR